MNASTNPSPARPATGPSFFECLIMGILIAVVHQYLQPKPQPVPLNVLPAFHHSQFRIPPFDEAHDILNRTHSTVTPAQQ